MTDGIGKAVKIARLSFLNTFRNAGEMKPDPGVSGNRLHDDTVSQPRCDIGGVVVGELAVDFLRARQIIDFSMGLALRARTLMIEPLVFRRWGSASREAK